jgi:AMMECR1 domain-containing protein
MCLIPTHPAGAREAVNDLNSWVASATAAEAMTHLRIDLIKAMSSGTAPEPSITIDWPGPPKGVFVSLIRGTEVIGCMGSFAPSRNDLYTAVLRTAVRATREDIRHRPLRPKDLDRARIVVTFVDPPAPIPGPEILQPWEEGLLAIQGTSSAVVVPGEAKTTRYALELALRQSGIDTAAPVEYYRFNALTWREERTELLHRGESRMTE